MPQVGSELLQLFCSLLTGRHSNQQQAFENPPFFAHIILKYRALPNFSTPTLLLEQGYAVDPNQPYRVRILQPSLRGDTAIRVVNHSLLNPQSFQGASESRAVRDTITETTLRVLEGCSYDVTQSGPATFVGTTEPGCRCLIQQRRQHLSGESFPTQSKGHDDLGLGYDLTTKERVWGSVAGEFSFHREEDWSDEIPEHWWSKG